MNPAGYKKPKRKSVKDLMSKNEPTVSKAAAGDAVRNLLSTAMSKGKVKSLKVKVKFGGNNE